MVDQLPEELRALKTQMKSFINDVVVPREPELMNEDASADFVAEELKENAKKSGFVGSWASLGDRRRRASVHGFCLFE